MAGCITHVIKCRAVLRVDNIKECKCKQEYQLLEWDE